MRSLPLALPHCLGVLAAALTPRRPLAVSQWADDHRVLSGKQAGERGRWRTARNPILREIMDCLSASSRVTDIWVMKAAQMAGNMIAREDVEAALKAAGALMRAEMDVFPDQNAAELCALRDLGEVHALLTERCRNVLHNIGVAIERQMAALQHKGA